MDTTSTTLIAAAQQAAEVADFGTPTARKAGRNPAWPYVPVVRHTMKGTVKECDSQIRGLAYATHEQAVEGAAAYIRAQRTALAERLLDPRMRALREQHGLPREIPREV